MGLTEILALFRVGMATWKDVADAIESVQSEGGVSPEVLAAMRDTGNAGSDALGESISRRESGDS